MSDPAIRNELKVLEAAEAVREQKHKEAFKGYAFQYLSRYQRRLNSSLSDS